MTARSAKESIPEVLPPAANALIAEIYQLIRADRAGEALPRLDALKDLCCGKPMVLNENEGAVLIDIGSQIGSVDLVKRGISLLRSDEVRRFPETAQRAHLYNLGNAYGALHYGEKIPSGTQRALDPNFGLAKQYYRNAMALAPGSPECTARLYTNYGILLRDVGRHVEEVEAYDEALKAVPGFAMALWNKAKGLRWYSRLVERPTKRSALLEAWDLIRRSLQAGLAPRFQAKAEEELAQLGRILKEPNPPAHKHTEHSANSDTESAYIRFCVDNRLYLHPCLVHAHEAYQDTLSVRFPTSVKDEFLELRSEDLALIKQEYIAARFLLFCYRFKQPDLSFVDRGTYLPSVQRANGQIYLQLLILSFRAAYAILDKIAFHLNTFCGLRIEEKRLYFREELFLARGVCRPELAEHDGTQLAALFDLAREFSRDQPLYPLRGLRHKLEHRCVAVWRTQGSAKDNGSSAGDEGWNSRIPADALTEDDLYQNSLRLLRAVRAAVFYLFCFIRMSVERRVARVRS